MTAGGTLLVLGAVAGMAAGGSAGFWLARQVGVAAPYVFVWRWLRWPVTAGAIALCAALGYHLLPDVRRKFKLLTPGSLLGTLAWFLATWGFGEYAAHIASYNVTYGAIGGVIVLMAWFYLTGFIFLLGGEINVIFEARARRENHYTGCGGRRTRPAMRPSYESGPRINMQLSSRDHFDLRRSVPMSREEEHRCAVAYVKTKDPALAERLIVANMRMVVALAHHYCRADDDLQRLRSRRKPRAPPGGRQVRSDPRHQVLQLRGLVDPGVHVEAHDEQLAARQGRDDAGPAQTLLLARQGTGPAAARGGRGEQPHAGRPAAGQGERRRHHVGALRRPARCRWRRR